MNEIKFRPASTPASGVPVAKNAAPARVPLELLRDRAPSAVTLARAGYGTVDQLYDAVASQFHLARMRLDDVELALDLLNLVPKDLATKHYIVPVYASFSSARGA